MFVKNKHFISNKVKVMTLILDTIIILAAMSLLVLTIIGQIKQDSTLYIVSTIFWICGLFSISDFIFICRLGRPIVNYLYIKLFYHFGKQATSEQMRVLDNIFANSEGKVANVSVFIMGKPLSGKTESINFIIDYILRNFILRTKQQINGYEYVDCYNDANLVTCLVKHKFLYSFNNKILIFDNINEADGSAIEMIKEICSKKNCCTLVIEENDECALQKFKFDEVVDSTIEFFNNNFLTIHSSSIKAILESLSKNNYVLNVLLSIAILTRYHKVCHINDIKKLSKLHGTQLLKLKNSLRKLVKLNLIEVFPINSYYYRLNNSISSDEFLFDLFPVNTLRDKKLIEYRKLINHPVEKVIIEDEIFKNEVLRDEILWLNLLDLPISERSKFSFTEHINLFSSAIDHANFLKLNNALQAFYRRVGNNHEFLYEEGFLSYILNDYTKAICCFEKLLSLDISNKLVYEFKFIETLHGSCEEKIINKIQMYINDLLASKEKNFCLYGKYWQIHIESERGNFKIDSLNCIRESLISLYNDKFDDGMILSVIERCFTDQLRMYWMSGTLLSSRNKQLQEEFTNIFSSKSSYNYYLNLYFQAGYYHYHKICYLFFKNGEHEIEEYAKCAKTAYETALSCDYQKPKSKVATSVKLVDLKAIFNDAEYDDLIQEVKRFRLDAEKNRIDVFIAFSDSLIGKLRILDFCISDYPREENVRVTRDINTALDNSEQIYAQYKNEYGVVRARLLKSLYRLLLSFADGEQAINEAQIALKSIHIPKEWSLENAAIESMSRKNLKYKDVYDCIKFYPMILQ